MMKICTLCKQKKDIDLFSLNKYKKDGHSCWCKDCFKKYKDQHKDQAHRLYESQKDKQIQRTRERRSANMVEARKQDKKNYETRKNKGLITAYNKKKYKIKKEENLKYAKEWREKYPEKVLEQRKKYYADPINRQKIRIRNAKHRHQTRASEGTYTQKDIDNILKRQKNKCYWCGINMKNNYTVDHYEPISKGGVSYPWNIVLSCLKCNTSKRDKDPTEFAKKFQRLF
jgi:hypothetical protein